MIPLHSTKDLTPFPNFIKFSVCKYLIFLDYVSMKGSSFIKLMGISKNP